jgi:hypothetical protein
VCPSIPALKLRLCVSCMCWHSVPPELHVLRPHWGFLGPDQDVGTALHPGPARYDLVQQTHTFRGSGENMWFVEDDPITFSNLQPRYPERRNPFLPEYIVQIALDCLRTNHSFVGNLRDPVDGRAGRRSGDA